MVRSLLAFGFAMLLARGALASPLPPVEDYGKLPAMSTLSLSPSGQRYAFVAEVGGVRRLYVATTANQPIESDTLGSLKVDNIEWAGEDHLLIHISKTVDLGMEFLVSKQELEEVIVVDLKQHRSFSVFGDRKEIEISRTVIGTYGTAEINGHWYGYFGGLEYDQLNLYKVDLDTGDTRFTRSEESDLAGWLLDAKGELAARLRLHSKTGQWRVLAGKTVGGEIASGSISAQSVTEDVSLDGLGRTPDSYLLYVGDAEHGQLREASLSGGPVVATFDGSTFGHVMRDRTTKLWIGTTSPEDGGRPKLFSPERQAKLDAAFKAFPNEITHLISYDADFNRMIVKTEGPDDSGTYWIVDIAKRSANVLGEEYPTIRADHIGASQRIDYKAGDGMVLNGILTLPPDRKATNLPLVVIPHGGPEDHDILGFDYWPQAFASRGYAVFQPNFRGSDGFGTSYRDAGFGEWGRKMQTDVSYGVAELVREGKVDPKRICIAGWSYGGYAALAGVTVQHGIYRCAVSMAGPSDLPGMLAYERDSTGQTSTTTRYWRKFMGVTTGWSQTRDISPAALADKADAPILLVHGQDDTVVPPEQSETMAKALRTAGKSVELITLPGADHWLLEEPSRVAMLKASVEFVMKHNPPDPASTVTAAK
ncbi:alpha/beta hydrolase family protein [Phenylobacterium montanum]|uniref:S9 family peptidase n=1 Tax=Phenylobacterium montanum TaxID=2823693 RepID=A0A975IU90_9CAUL|nr:alpha/beta fold hydrolase [Caulobacter sp. S6]QUD85996.1 S9 family peptidase [Caulobacter sp. S6]